MGELVSLDRMAPGRLIAGLGTGDSKSAAENLAFGIPFAAPDERRVALRECAASTCSRPACRCGWAAAPAPPPSWPWSSAPPSTCGRASPPPWPRLQPRCEVTWAGPVAEDAPRIAQWLQEVAGAGATWAVCAWPESLEAVAEAAAMVRAT